MEKHTEKARAYFRDGYNCCQSVVLSFAEDLGYDKKTLLMLSSSFGGGMGRLREVCGAVSAMFMIAGFEKGYTSPNDDITKGNHYELIQNLASEFKKFHGTIICRELLELDHQVDTPTPSKRTEEYYEERPCEKFVVDATNIIDEFLLNLK